MVEALTHYEQALAIARDLGDRRNEGVVLSGLGLLHLAHPALCALCAFVHFAHFAHLGLPGIYRILRR